MVGGDFRVKIDNNCNRKNSGFTVIEVLITTAILVVLLSISFIAVAAYRSHLKITELDNAAREIYMAAQNRAVLLKNRDRLAELTIQKGEGSGAAEYVNQLKRSDDAALYYFVTSKQIKEMKDMELLPQEAIEPSLWDGFFYIVYEPESGSVTDVFYAEKEFLTGNFAGNYEAYRVKERKERMKENPMIGYYGGEPSVAGDTYTPRTPMLRIINDNELTVEVSCWLPQDLAEEEKNVQLTLTLQYGEQSVELYRILLSELESPASFPADGIIEESDRFERLQYRVPDAMDAEDYYKYTCAYVLESLKDGKKFGDLGKFTSPASDGSWTTPFGREFTVTAEIAYTGSSQLINGATKSASDNSLFATSTLGNTAHIACLRHLQNLDQAFSGVDSNSINPETGGYDPEVKYFAIQIADIENLEIEEGGEKKFYNFIPINNFNILMYDGGDHSIKNLYIEDSYYAGLFGLFMPGVKEEDMAEFFPDSMEFKGRGFHNIRLVNTRVRETGAAASVGALCGVANNAEIENCWVYCEPYEKDQKIVKLLGKTSYDQQYVLADYMLEVETTSDYSFVGGLVGNGALCKISNCFVATTIKGSHVAAGLIGMPEKVEVHNSYADCYIEAKEAAGLLGYFDDEETCKITNCFAAGYIVLDEGSDARSAGITLLEDFVTVQNSYAAIAYGRPKSEDTSDLEKRYPLVAAPNKNEAEGLNIKIENSHYLYSPYVNNDGWSDYMVDYDQLVDKTEWEALFPSHIFDGKNPNTEPGPDGTGGAYYTHAYNLQDGITLKDYPYPAFDSMPHYGDWPEAHQKGDLVYWERYKDEGDPSGGSIGVKGSPDSTLKDLPDSALDTLREEALVVEDGYAVLLSGDVVDKLKDETEKITIRFERFPEKGKKQVTYRSYGTKAVEDTDLEKAVTALIPVSWKLTDETEITYYLAPLPDEWIVSSGADKHEHAEMDWTHFYQKIRFTIDNSTIPCTYFFNPHFASTVIEAESYGQEIPKEEIANITVSVRSPRHFYELSLHKEYYNGLEKKYTFTQELDLDYGVYTGYGLFVNGDGEATDVKQPPVGTSEGEPFHQVYDGGCHTIIKVPLETSGDHVGLFGCNEGEIRDVVFLGNGVIDRDKDVPEQPMVIAGSVSSGSSLNIGTLVGLNGESGNITNCAVAYVALSVEGEAVSELSCGGLVGFNQGTISQSAATLDFISVENLSSGNVFVGGFAGRNGDVGSDSAVISFSYAIGRVHAEEATAGVHIGGFTGSNGGVLKASYAACDLTDCGSATVYAFCPIDSANTAAGCYYLNKGSFTYLNQKFYADYKKENTQGTSLTWAELTADTAIENLNQETSSVFARGAQYDTEEVYVFPAAVKAAEAYVHYGNWPLKEDGLLGLFYWEREQKGTSDFSYHISAILVDPDEKAVSKISNLCTNHADGGVIKEYGYGYFYDNVYEGALKFTVKDGIDQELIEESHELKDDPLNAIMEAFKNTYDLYDLTHVSISLDDYKWIAYQTINMDATEESGRHLMYLMGGKRSSEWDLSVNDVTYQFDMNPFFAEAISFKGTNPGDEFTLGAGVVTGDLGREALPFGIRSIEQLQYINWNHAEKRTDIVGKNGKVRFAEIPILFSSPYKGYIGMKDEKTNSKDFTFLNHVSFDDVDGIMSGLLNKFGWDWIGNFSNDSVKLYWKQSHNIDGTQKSFTPIAAFQDTSSNDSEGLGLGELITEKVPLLSSWFGGSYDGDYYTIEDVNIAAGNSDYVGLFGVTMNASLKNIILYSSGEESRVTCSGSVEAAGGLVGMAITEQGVMDSGIENCAVADYGIILKPGKDANGNEDNGCYAGGLVGAAYTPITYCAAVTDIQVEGEIERNIRIGGIAGSSRTSIEYSYSGGTLALPGTISGKTSAGMGGIVGGSSMKKFQIPAGGSGLSEVISDSYTMVLKNCYTYERMIPPQNATSGNFDLYAIGGTDSGSTGGVQYGNCFYLNGSQKDGIFKDETNVTGKTYGEISGNVLNSLNEGLAGGSIRYQKAEVSYSTTGETSYPFPAIIRTKNAVGTIIYAHYGVWPSESEWSTAHTFSTPSGDVSGGDGGPGIENEGTVSGGDSGPEIFDENRGSNSVVSGGDPGPEIFD